MFLEGLSVKGGVRLGPGFPGLLVNIWQLCLAKQWPAHPRHAIGAESSGDQYRLFRIINKKQYCIMKYDGVILCGKWNR